MPKVSILMTSYNHEEFIKESIESILNQTFKDFELIIVDDCSQDSSFEIIKSFNDKRIKAIRNERNMGPEYAFEVLQQIAKGEFVAVADSDNVWEKNKLQKQVIFLEKNPHYGAVFTRANIINENGKPYTDEKSTYYSVFNAENRSRQEWLNYFFHNGNCLCHPSVLIRKDIYIECQMIIKGLWQAPDFYKWIRLCLKYEIYILEDKLINFRIHENNISGTINVENVLRGNNEIYHIYNLFYEINKEDFLIAFKQSSKFIVNGKINTKFAVSKLLLSLNIPAATTLALNKLFEMLNNNEERAQIFELYNYDDVSYKNDETEYSPFVLPNWSHNSIHEAKLYFDFDNGFNEKDTIVKKYITDSNGNFQIKFNDINNFCKGRKLLNLRFDPCDTYSKVEIKNIYSNRSKADFDINVNNFLENQYFKKENYDIFYTDDPSYIITNFEKSLETLSILGKISFFNSSELLQLKNSEINELNAKLQNIYASSSWKITKLFRIVKKKLTSLSKSILSNIISS